MIRSVPTPTGLAWSGRLLAVCTADWFRHKSLVVLALVLAVALPCFLRTYLGKPFIAERYGPDAFIVLDGAWRVLNGQVPHRDFHSSLGPVFYLIGAAGLKLGSSSAVGLNYSQALAGLIFGLWAFALACRRLPAIFAGLYSILVVLLAIAPYELGESPLLLAPATTYNRYCYVLLTLILVESVCPPMARFVHRSREERLGGISTGVALALALFIKVSFFLGALMLLGAVWMWRKQSGTRIAALCAAFGVTAGLVVVFLLRGEVTGMLYDLRMAAAGKKVVLRYAAEILVKNMGVILSVVALAVFISLIRTGKHWSDTIRVPMMTIAICAVSYLVILGNHQETGMPLVATLGIVLASRAAEEVKNAPLLSVVLVAWAAFLFAPLLIADAAGLGYGALKSFSYKPSSVAEFHSPLLQPLVFTSTINTRDFGSGYVRCVNEGLEMLRVHPKSVRVVTLANTDPFPHAAGLVPARGGITWIADGNNMSPAFKPAAEDFFADASLVLVSRYVSDGGALRLYGDYVKQHFQVTQESPCWELYIRTRSR